MPSPLASPPDQVAGSIGSATLQLALTRSDDPTKPLAELAGEPVTIGSGPRCAIRLADAGLRPLHCVVTPTDEGPRVRSWAPGAQLNGEEFDEAGLACGDLLKLGGVELLVVDLADELTETEQGGRLSEEPPSLSTTNLYEVPSEPTDSEVSSPDPIDLTAVAGSEWTASADCEPELAPIEGSIAESVRAWTEALPVLESGDPCAPIPVAPGYEAELDSLREQLAAAVSAAEASASMAERLNRRQKNNRRRALRLLEELRRRHSDADLMRLALEERDQTMSDLQTRLDSALALGDAVREEFAEMQAAHAMELESQAERLEADYAAKLAEAQSDQGAMTLPTEVEEPTGDLAQAFAPNGTEEMPPASVETEGHQPESSVWGGSADPEDAESFAAAQHDEQAEPTPGVEEDGLEAIGLSVDPGGDVEPPIDHSPAEGVSPWGIEQLADAEDPAPPAEPMDVFDQGEETESLRGAQEAGAFSEPMVDWFAGEATEEPSEGQVDEPALSVTPQQTETHSEPQSFIEKYGHLLPEEDEEVESPPVIEAPVELVENESEAEAEADESIDDYMSRLMQRVRGESPAPEPRKEVRAAKTVTPKPSAQPSEPADAPEPEPAPNPIQCLSELTPSEAPEASADMDALRQLANHSARNAIHVASTNQSKEHAVVCLAGSVFGIVAGAIASMTAISPWSVQFLGGLVVVLGSGWYGVKTLGFFQSVAAEEELAEAREQA